MSFIQNSILTLQSWPPEFLWLLMLLTCFSSVLLLYRFFGTAGLYVYIVLAMIGANIQVLKAVQFGLYPEPVALGTILFASAYLATDILAEQHGAKAAQKGVWLGFAGYLIFTVLMLLNLGFAPLTPEQAGETMAWALPYHEHMAALFTPAPTFLIAGMCAYLLSQLHDIWLFSRLKAHTGGRFLWLRNNASTLLSALIDNAIFSILAWIVLASDPLPWQTVLVTYILGTYWLRVIVALFDTPFIYLACYWSPNNDDSPRVPQLSF